jgi:hypothetical protein
MLIASISFFNDGEQYPACCRVFKTLQRPDIRINRSCASYPYMLGIPSAYMLAHQRRAAMATHQRGYRFAMATVFRLRAAFSMYSEISYCD